MSGGPTTSGAEGSVGGPGSIEAEGAHARIVFRRLLHHPIQDVWDAITEPGQLESWFLVKVTREGPPGGRLTMEYPNGVRGSGRVLEWDPPRVYEYEWNLDPAPNRPAGESSVVRWDLSATDGGTVLVLTHRKLSNATAKVFVRGLRVFLDRLSAHLDGRPLPDPPWAAAALHASSSTERD